MAHFENCIGLIPSLTSDRDMKTNVLGEEYVWLILASYANEFFQSCHPDIFNSITFDDNHSFTNFSNVGNKNCKTKFQILQNVTIFRENIDKTFFVPYTNFIYLCKFGS